MAYQALLGSAPWDQERFFQDHPNEHFALMCAYASDLASGRTQPLTSGGFLPLPAPRPSNPANSSVFVGGLQERVNEAMLREIFSFFGHVIGVRILGGKHCGFVSFADQHIAETALHALQGIPLGGQPLRLAWGVDTKPKRGNASQKGLYAVLRLSMEQRNMVKDLLLTFERDGRALMEVIELLDSAQVGPDAPVPGVSGSDGRPRAFLPAAGRRESYDQSIEDHFNSLSPPDSAFQARHRSPTLPSESFTPFRSQTFDSIPDWREPRSTGSWQVPGSHIPQNTRTARPQPISQPPMSSELSRAVDGLVNDNYSPPETASSKALDTPSRASSYQSEPSAGYMTRNRGSTSSTFSQIITSPTSQAGDDIRTFSEKADNSTGASPFSFGLGLAFTPPDELADPPKKHIARDSDPIVPGFASLALNDSIWGLNTSAEPFMPKSSPYDSKQSQRAK